MNEREIIRRNMQNYFDKHNNKNIVVLPLRNLSGVVTNILREEYAIQEQFLVDNYAYDMTCSYPMDKMPNEYSKCVFFMAAYGSTKKALKEQLLKYVSEDKIVDLLYDEEREQIFTSDHKVHLDFLSPGFAKCGTTSLHYALSQNPAIFLPQVKETQFLRYSVNKESHEVFRNQYKADETAGKIVGGIEPSYIQNVEDVYRYFGKELKLIFWVRDPVKSLYSNFKMSFRNGLVMLDSDPMELDMMGEFDHVCPEMFVKYAEENRYRKLYTNYIKDFLNYYPLEQIKIVVAEEVFRDIHEQMDALQDFLGVGEVDKLDYQEFPKEHVGNKVAKDALSLGINIRMQQLNHRLLNEGDFKSLQLLKDIKEKVGKITLVEYNEPMLESTRRELLDFYMDSIHDLEDMLGRNLQGVWY